MSYAGLGATTTTRKRDELLRHTGAAATRLMAEINRLPVGQRTVALERALSRLSSDLPDRVRRVADHLRRTRRLDIDRAMHQALTLSMADALLDEFSELGRRVMSGDAMALGETPEQVMENLARGVSCSRGLQTSMTDIAGRQSGRTGADATSVGFELARSFATCPTDTPTETPLPPSQPTQTDSSNIIVPIVIGVGVLATLGGIIWFTRKKS